jgi:tetratricopeptide (TPR) repeat protein
VTAYDQAIAIRTRLVEREGRAELANDLAATLVNKGAALWGLSRPAEAVTAYDQAIAIRTRLVEREGRAELANDLAGALMNKGVALKSLGRLGEALAAYDQAIATYERLMEQEGRAELANDLAMALMNKGVAVEQLQRPQDSLECYRQAISLWEQLINAGQIQVTSSLVKGLRIRFDLFRGHQAWEAAAVDVMQALRSALPMLREESPSELLVQEVSNLVNALRALSPEERDQLFAALGENAAPVRQLLADR